MQIRVIAGELVRMMVMTIVLLLKHCVNQGIHLEESFGFAPSTLVHNGSQGPLGKHKM